MTADDGGVYKEYPYGTWEYMAAECWRPDYGAPSKPSDVFSFGIIIWEMFARRRVYQGFDGLAELAGKDGKVDVKKVVAWMADGRKRPAFPADCPLTIQLLCEACWVLPPVASPVSGGGHESADAKVERHKMAIDIRPTLPQIREVLGWNESIDSRQQKGRIEEIDWKQPAALAEPEPELEPELSYDDFLARLDLTDKKEILEGCGLDEGLELKQLVEMDVDAEDFNSDILDDADLEFDDETKARFRAAVLALQSSSSSSTVNGDEGQGGTADRFYRNVAWDSLLELLGAEHAVHLCTPGSHGWLSDEALRKKAEEQSKEIATLREQLAAA